MDRANITRVLQRVSPITGTAAAGVQVTVSRADGGAFTMYSTNSTSGSALSNPLTTDDKGFVAFYAADGVYNLDFNDGFPRQTIQLTDVAAVSALADKLQDDYDEFTAQQQQNYDDFIAVQGLIYKDPDTFTTGSTLNGPNEALKRESDGEYFRRTQGPYPYTVAPATDPTADTFYVAVGSASLAQRLASSNSDAPIADIPAKAIANYRLASYAALKDRTGLVAGDLVGVAEHYSSGLQYGETLRLVSATDDGTGIPLIGGLFANLILSGNVLKASDIDLVAGTDYASKINLLVGFMSANKVTEFRLDTGDIKFTGTLPFYFGGVTFSGIGRLLPSDLNNTLQRIGAEKAGKKYHGQFNVGQVYNAITKAQIQKKKEVRIVLFGDSISVCGDYDSFGTIPAGARPLNGVDNIVRDNCFGATLFNEIAATFPQDVRVKFYSRSVGGLDYNNIDQPWDSIGALWSGREQVTAGKTWRDCILDLNPDLVIHAMGMNESPTSYLNNFIVKWQNYLSEKQKTVSFDQAIVTTPNPNFIDADPFGDFRGYGFNASKFFVANMQRYVAKRFNYSLIDVAFNSYLKRYGIDSRSANYEAKPLALSFPDLSESKIVIAGSAPSLYEVTPKTLPLYWTIEFTLNLAAPSNTAGFDFKFTAGSIIFQLAGGNINLIAGNYGGAGLFLKTFAQVIPAGVNSKFTLTVGPSSIYLYLDDLLIIVMSDAPFNATLPMQFDNSGGSANVTVVSGRTFGVQFARYAQDAVSNGDYYGLLDFTQNPNGGGVNHPSSTMLAEVYLPPTREYLSEIMRSHQEFDTVIGGTSAGQMVFLGRILNKPFNRISIKDRASTRETIIDVTGSTTWNLVKNTGGAVSIYIDPFDMSIFLFNPSDPVFQIEYSGDWLIKRPVKLGLTTPRGTLLSAVP